MALDPFSVIKNIQPFKVNFLPKLQLDVGDEEVIQVSLTLILRLA